MDAGLLRLQTVRWALVRIYFVLLRLFLQLLLGEWDRMEKSLCIIFSKSVPKLVLSTKKDVSGAGGSRAVPLRFGRPCQSQSCRPACGEREGRPQCPQTFHGGEALLPKRGGRNRGPLTPELQLSSFCYAEFGASRLSLLWLLVLRSLKNKI